MKIFIFRFLISLLLLNTICFASNYASLSPVLTEIIYALNGENNLVGISSICNYPQSVKNKEIIGDTYFVNMEKLVKLKPDYLFSMESNKPLLGQLSLINIKPIYFEFSNLNDIYRGIEKIAKLINKEKEATKLNKEIKEKISKSKTNKSKKILYIAQFNPLITIGNKSYINDVIAKSGHKNATSEINFYYPSITLEYAIKTNPDVVVLFYNNGIDEAKKYFPNSKIIQLNKEEQDIINRPGPRIWKAVEIFSNL